MRKEIKIDPLKATLLILIYFVTIMFGVAGIINTSGLLFTLSMTLFMVIGYAINLLYEFDEEPIRTHLKHFDNDNLTLCGNIITSNIKLGNLREEISCSKCKELLDKVIYH